MRRIVAAVAFVVAGAAWAQAGVERREAKSKDPGRDHVFTPSELEGGAPAPSLKYVAVPIRGDFDNLIKMRVDFNPELQRSVDEL